MAGSTPPPDSPAILPPQAPRGETNLVSSKHRVGHPPMDDSIRLLSKSDVERLLDMRSCIDGVENAFRLKGEGRPSHGGILGVHVPGGGFHAKAAVLELSRPYFAAKINANFPENPS